MKSNDVIHTISYDIHANYFITHFDSIIIFKVVKPYIFYVWEGRDVPFVQHNCFYPARYLGKRSLNLNVEENHGQSRGLRGNGPSVGPVHHILHIIVMFNLIVYGVGNDEQKGETFIWFIHLLLPSICDVFILMLWMTIISQLLKDDTIIQGGFNQGNYINRIIDGSENVFFLLGSIIT